MREFQATYAHLFPFSQKHEVKVRPEKKLSTVRLRKIAKRGSQEKHERITTHRHLRSKNWHKIIARTSNTTAWIEKQVTIVENLDKRFTISPSNSNRCYCHLLSLSEKPIARRGAWPPRNVICVSYTGSFKLNLKSVAFIIT